MAKRPGNHDDDVDLSTYASSNRVDKTHPAHPAFLAKLSEILDAPDGESIRWSDSGETFVVADPVLFAKIVLPKYFKHSNFASFVRQLNLYGFYKTTADPNWCEFRNEHFRRDQRDLMKHIKRKSGPERCSKAVLAMDEQQTAPNSGGSSSDSVASELCMLKRKQKVVEHTLMTVRREYEVLWSELQACRQQVDRIRSALNTVIGAIITAMRTIAAAQDDATAHAAKRCRRETDTVGPVGSEERSEPPHAAVVCVDVAELEQFVRARLHSPEPRHIVPPCKPNHACARRSIGRYRHLWS